MSVSQPMPIGPTVIGPVPWRDNTMSGIKDNNKVICRSDETVKFGRSVDPLPHIRLVYHQPYMTVTLSFVFCEYARNLPWFEYIFLSRNFVNSETRLCLHVWNQTCNFTHFRSWNPTTNPNPKRNLNPNSKYTNSYRNHKTIIQQQKSALPQKYALPSQWCNVSSHI